MVAGRWMAARLRQLSFPLSRESACPTPFASELQVVEQQEQVNDESNLFISDISTVSHLSLFARQPNHWCFLSAKEPEPCHIKELNWTLDSTARTAVACWRTDTRRIGSETVQCASGVLPDCVIIDATVDAQAMYIMCEQREERDDQYLRGVSARRLLEESQVAIILGTVLSALLVLSLVVIFLLLRKQSGSGNKKKRKRHQDVLFGEYDSDEEDSSEESDSSSSHSSSDDLFSSSSNVRRKKKRRKQRKESRKGRRNKRQKRAPEDDEELGHLSEDDLEGKRPRATPQALMQGEALFGIDLSKLRFGAMIGQGANGRVYKASYLGSDVAVKEIKSISANDEVQQDFFTELEALRRLRHPHVVELYGAAVVQASDSVGGIRYLLVTELAPCSLRDLLESDEPINLMQALRLATEISRGCAYIHAMKVVHYDIKPANLLLSDSGKIKICDLGIAKLGSQLAQLNGTVTGPVGLQGTPTYIAPEILRGETSVLSYSVDVYSWAIVFWEVLHRRKPHPQEWTLAILFTKLLKGYRPQIGPLTPARIRRLLLKCWAHDPEKRPEFEQILVELSWAEQELRHPERAFLSSHIVAVWQKDQFVKGRISRNRGDGTYEVVLDDGIPRPTVFHASEILLIDGGGGLISFGSQEELDEINATSTGEDGAPLTRRRRQTRITVVNDERQPRPVSGENSPPSDEFTDSSDASLKKEVSAIKAAKRAKKSISSSASSTSSSSSSDTDDLVSSNDDSNAVDVDGIRIGVYGIVKPRVSPSSSSVSSDVSQNSFSKRSFSEDLVVLNEIGRGASGRVNRALHLQTFQLVAIKSIRLYSESSRAQIAKEIRALDACVRQAGSEAAESLLQMYGAFFDPDEASVKIVMEYMDGGSCHDMLRNWERPDEALLVAIAKGALRSLRELHNSHRLHRDIKPANILIDRRVGAKLSDLGLARDMLAQGGLDDENDAMAETFVGTIAYMSPERLEGRSYSYPADVWALGVSLTALAIGSNPVREKSFFQLLEYLRKGTFPEVDQAYSDLFRDFLSKCLQTDPAKRGTAAELCEHPWILSFEGMDKVCPEAVLRAYIERSAEGARYKRDELNDIASRVYSHIQMHAPGLSDGSGDTKIVVPLSKVRRLSEQLGVPVRYTIKAFKQSLS